MQKAEESFCLFSLRVGLSDEPSDPDVAVDASSPDGDGGKGGGVGGLGRAGIGAGDGGHLESKSESEFESAGTRCGWRGGLACRDSVTSIPGRVSLNSFRAAVGSVRFQMAQWTSQDRMTLLVVGLYKR